MQDQVITPRRTDRAESNETLIQVRLPLAGASALASDLDRMARPGDLYEKLEGGRVHCYACAHNCHINPGGRGICQVRYNADGTLYVPRGYVAALQCDPIEKKPFSHVLPSADALTFGMLGCDLHCGYCQNWDISQALRDASAGHAPTAVTPEQMVAVARQQGARVIASSYNEPLITSEWAVEIFKQAQQAGFLCAYVSNGNATREVLEYIRPYVSAYKIDLKSMRDKQYRQLGAPLEHILDGIRMVHELGFWLELVTLIVPGFNNDPAELRDAAQFIASVSRDIPWHVTAFHADYKMTENDNTSAQDLLTACEIGRDAGLNYIYAGNLPRSVGDWESTFCHNCRALLVERQGYMVTAYNLTAEGTCPTCNTPIPGIWHTDPAAVHLGDPDSWWMRRPRSVR